MTEKKSPRVLVTGASGFIGKHLTRDLISRGFNVRAVYRSSPIHDHFKDIDSGTLDIQQADLRSADDIIRICKGCDIVIHTAALAIDWGPLPLFIESNYNITVNLIEEAQKEGCRKFIYISSAAVHGFGNHVDTKESGPFFKLKHPYPITKKMAEDYVLTRNTVDFSVTAIRPANAYGPGDQTSTYEMFRQITGGVMGYISGGRKYTCPVYIDDLCAGIIAAVKTDNIGGEVITISDGSKVRWKEYVNRMFEVAGAKRKPQNLPAPIAYAAAYILLVVYKILPLKGVPKLTLYRVEQGSQNYHFDNTKAKELLGFEPSVLYREGLKKTWEAFAQDSLIK